VSNEFLQALMSKMVRLSLTDGRIIVGTLACTDNTPNIIITSADEYWKKDGVDGFIRHLGTITICGKHITDVSVLRDDLKKATTITT